MSYDSFVFDLDVIYQTNDFFPQIFEAT